MIEIVKVVEVRPLDDRRLWLRFSNGWQGVRDLSDLLTEGGEMVEPLRDPAFFNRVFISCGVPSWPNGFDLDAINLYRELRDAGLLTQDAAA
ncbi:MAG: DUF2442 domain-containing protein [Rhizobiales bacterium]|nr:DUF2442 domain-containing protein [Hyphomicrobiales bacterium]